MANYLERVASSAGRRAAIAKPPASGPPVLPAGRDYSIGPADPFASDEEQFVETLETSRPAPTQERVEIPAAPKVEVASEPIPTATHDAPLDAPVEPSQRPHTSVERLSSDSPFTVHLPRTLRPSVAAKVPLTAAEEQPRVRTGARASTIIGPEEFTVEAEPVPRVRSDYSDVGDVKESVVAEADTTALTPRPKPPVAEEEHQVPRPVHTETAVSDTTPIPRVDRVDGPPKAQSAEPSPPPALPVHLPPVAGNSARQEPSRIHIGSLEVLVNNHPRVPTVRPAAPPSRTERLNLEKRYLDRFRLRH